MKKSHRVLRDASIVVVFCVGFLALIVLANFLQNDGEKQTSSEFSEYRLSADKAAEGRDLNVSLQNLRGLIKNDPFDGRAQYELASTLFSQVIESQDAATEASRNEPPAQTELPSQSEQASEVPLNDQSAGASPSVASEAKLTSLIDQAIQEYKLAQEHPRYRSRSQIQLAVLFASKGDHRDALDTLENFVNDGGATRRGLDQIEQLGSSLDRKGPTKLHAYPRFSMILALEQLNRSGKGGPPSINWFPNLSLHDTNTWNFLERLNNDLIPYRIKLVDLISKLLKQTNIMM